ncbi:sensor domain-containing diguanylate cyclase [Mycoplasmatota bacterium WC44]
METENYLKKELYDLIKINSNIFEFIQSGSLDGLWYWDLENPNQEWMNSKFWTTLGYDPTEKKHLCSEWQDIIFSEDLIDVKKSLELHLEDSSIPYDQIVRYRHKNGSTVWIRCRGIAIRNEKGEAVRLLGAHQDVTEIKRLQNEAELKNEELQKYQKEIEELNKRLEIDSLTDSLTKLWNRRAIDSMLTNEVSRSKRTNTVFSVLLLDMNNFKDINDNCGHLAGDEVLIKASDRIVKILRNYDIVARWGGDEFLIILPGESIKNARLTAGRIIEENKNKFITFDKYKIPYSFCIGIAEFNNDISLRELLSNADKELYKAKRESKENRGNESVYY